MNTFIAKFFDALCIAGCPVFGDEVSLDFPKKVREVFRENPPIRLEVIRENGEIKIQVVNISKQFVAISKIPDLWERKDLSADGSVIEEGVAIVPAANKELLDHAVLRPKGDSVKEMIFSKWTVWKMSSRHESAVTCVLEISLSGYFPAIDDYITFSITGNFDLENETDE